MSQGRYYGLGRHPQPVGTCLIKLFRTAVNTSSVVRFDGPAEASLVNKRLAIARVPSYDNQRASRMRELPTL